MATASAVPTRNAELDGLRSKVRQESEAVAQAEAVRLSAMKERKPAVEKETLDLIKLHMIKEEREFNTLFPRLALKVSDVSIANSTYSDRHDDEDLQHIASYRGTGNITIESPNFASFLQRRRVARRFIKHVNSKGGIWESKRLDEESKQLIPITYYRRFFSVRLDRRYGVVGNKVRLQFEVASGVQVVYEIGGD